MKTRSFYYCLALVCAGSTAALFACAGNEVEGGPEPEPDTSLVTPSDAGADADDAAELDEGDPAIPCTDDVLCPFGPFESNTKGGPLDIRTRINAIRARGRSDVWLAGVAGTVAHYDGTSWARSETGTTETMKALWLRDGDEIAIATLASFYGRNFDPAGTGVDAGVPTEDGWAALAKPVAPTQFNSSTKLVSSAWSAPGAEWVWITTIENRSLNAATRPVNGIWRLHVMPGTSALELGNALPAGRCDVLGCRQMTAVHGISADDLWVVGFTGATIRITDAQSASPQHQAFDSRTWTELNGVWAASETDAWAVGGNGVIRHYTGHPFAWEIVSDVPTTETLRGVWGSSPTDVWAVGDAATVLHYDGKSWSRVAIAGLRDRRPNLYSVWSPGKGRIWIGGDGIFLSLGGKP